MYSEMITQQPMENKSDNRPCIQKKISTEGASILLGVYTLGGVFFFSLVHNVTFSTFSQEGLSDPSIQSLFHEAKIIGLAAGILSGLFIMLLTSSGKKRGLWIVVIGNLVMIGLNFFILSRPLEFTIGPFSLGEFSGLMGVVLLTSYYIFRKANPDFCEGKNSLMLAHRRFLATFRFFSSALITGATGGIVAILILIYQIFPAEVIHVPYTMLVGAHLLFGGYVLLGFFLGCVWQILQICKEIEKKINQYDSIETGAETV